MLRFSALWGALLGLALASSPSSGTLLTAGLPPAPGTTLTALTTDPAGQPVLAWVAPEGRYNHLRAARWTGQRWTPMGGVLNENLTHNASRLSAVRGPDGQPWLGWAEDAGEAHVESYLISRWDGRAWSDPGRYVLRRNFSDAGKSQAFTVTAQNTPYLTWTNIYYPGAQGGVVQPFTWLGKGWEEHAPPLNRSLRSAAFFPAAARGADGEVYTAWLEGDVAHSDVYVARQEEGGRWQRLGGALNVHPHTYTFSPRLAAGKQGVVAAWLEDVNGVDNVLVKRWTGKAWQPLGGSLNVNGGQLAEWPALALDQAGQPVVAWTEEAGAARHVHAKRWTGTGWQALGGALNLNAAQDAFSASVTVDGGGRIVVAWCEAGPGGARVVTRQFAP